MKKYLALFVAFAVSMAVAASASAQIRFKDVPDDHWAASAVYDLVKLGVTKGYPDGTFRGKNKITRYETAVFLSKLAKVVGTEDIKEDLRTLRNEITALKARPGGGALSGSYLASWKFGNLLAESGGIRGAVASYRLKLSTARDLGEGAKVKINLDTMDYGYMQDGSAYNGDNLATELLDIESNLELDLAALGLENPVGLTLTYGPGARTHEADPAGPLPSEVGVVYERPDTGIMASTQLWGMDVSGGYIAQDHPATGRVRSSLITGTVGYAFEDVPLLKTLKLEATGDYYSSGQFSSKTRDMRATIALAAPLAEKVEASGKFGLGGTEQKNWMVAGEVALNDVWDTGTVANITVSKIGSDYITDRFAAEEFDIAGLDNFNRALEEGTVNLGGEVVQAVSENIKLVGKGDIRLAGDYKYEAPKGRLTAEGGISYAIAPNTTLDAKYLIHQDKSTNDTSDVAALGLMYEF
ncbi:MAG: S-layer homology domain-containing protein [Candidatus Margulisiibacteriota bacterium]